MITRSASEIYACRRLAKRIHCLGILGAVFALGSFAFAFNGSPELLGIHGLIIAAWTLVPPAWFAFEYFFVFDNWCNAKAAQEFKHVETLTSKIWAGMLALLVVIYTSRKDITISAKEVDATHVMIVIGGLVVIVLGVLILISSTKRTSNSANPED